jgi:hypothetical protein
MGPLRERSAPLEASLEGTEDTRLLFAFRFVTLTPIRQSNSEQTMASWKAKK